MVTIDVFGLSTRSYTWAWDPFDGQTAILICQDVKWSSVNKYLLLYANVQ